MHLLHLLLCSWMTWLHTPKGYKRDSPPLINHMLEINWKFVLWKGDFHENNPLRSIVSSLLVFRRIDHDVLLCLCRKVVCRKRMSDWEGERETVKVISPSRIKLTAGKWRMRWDDTVWCCAVLVCGIKFPCQINVWWSWIRRSGN